MAPKKNQTILPLPPSMEMDDARRAVLDKALGDITKRYGEWRDHADG